ncbi:MAG: hypothetical protein AABY44_03460 [Nitrospirota bacterium]
MEHEIKSFTNAIGATEPTPRDKNYTLFKTLFKRSNYFLLNGKFLIIKISRSKKPFYGVDKDFIELLNKLDNYFLVLLNSDSQGWIYSKLEINSNISNSIWKLRVADNNYKINFGTLKDSNFFTSRTQFLEKIK